MKMKRPLLFVITWFCFLSCNGPKEPELKSLNEGRLLSPNFFFSLPYEETANGAAVITVGLNGKKYRFMIDTGAPLSLSKSLQKELNFPVLQDTQLRDANDDSTSVKIVRVQHLSIGAAQVEDVPALVLDLDSPLFACDKFDGLIGSNLLRLLIIQFNKPEKKILFGDNLDSFHLNASSTSLAMQLNDVQSDPWVAVRLNNVVTDTVLYDTGDGHLYNLSKTKFDGFNSSGSFSNTIVHKGTGVGSQGIAAANTNALPSLMVNIDSFGIGTTLIRNVITMQQYDSRSRMGRGLWDYGIMTMDYRHRKFYFTPHQPTAIFQAKPDFGFQYQERNGKFVATVVWEGTEAFRCGLKAGNEIIQMGNFVPKKVPLCNWQKLTEREVIGDALLIKYTNEKGETRQCSLHKLIR